MKKPEEKLIFKEIKKYLQIKHAFLGVNLNGFQLEYLFFANLIKLRENPEGRIIAVMHSGEYLIVSTTDTPDYRQLPQMVQITQTGAINLDNITKVDEINRLVYCAEQLFLVEQPYWNFLLEQYRKRLIG